MITVEREVVTRAPLSKAAAYLSDFTNTAKWDPHTEECPRLDSGPLQVGAKYRNVQR
ncbi:MAG: SRPBCC family protein [Actinomycetota bacterium]|nr:SRPBCC family protein [Actinomycetota bacterium]